MSKKPYKVSLVPIIPDRTLSMMEYEDWRAESEKPKPPRQLTTEELHILYRFGSDPMNRPR